MAEAHRQAAMNRSRVHPEYIALRDFLTPFIAQCREQSMTPGGRPDPDFVGEIIDALREDRDQPARARRYRGAIRRWWIEDIISTFNNQPA